MIKILYFARLREALKTESEELALDSSTATINALKSKLSARGDIWREIFNGDETVMVALNQEVAAQPDEALKKGDEIAFFPPVTGG